MSQYKMLSASKVVFKILAWIALSICILMGAGGFMAKGVPMIQQVISFILLALIGIFYLFLFVVASEAVTVLLEIKNNTQKAS